MNRLKGKVALVTGAGSGIGAATARLFAKEGARVAVADVDEQGANRTVAAIGEDGGEAVVIKCDVTVEAEVMKLVEDAMRAFSRLDIAFNNAGIAGPTESVSEIEKTEWDRVIATNLTGVFLCMKHEIHQMRKEKRGSIINMASIAGLAGYSAAPYCSSKHGVIGLSKVAAVEHRETGIRINVVCPGAIDTPMLRGDMQKRAKSMGQDLKEEELLKSFSGRIGKNIGRPIHIANTVLWLASDESEFVTGSTLVVDGGMLAGPAG